LVMHERRGRAISRYVDKLREHAVIQDDDGQGVSRGPDQIFDSFLDPENGS